MAIAVIGGLITSTLLTLVVVPVVYTLVDDLENFLKKKWGKGQTDQASNERGEKGATVIQS
jgi:predicted RND superfamily exporter protein